jgi:NAD(P)-dependent dehydrogenase (short-subunit alcohol dehydrogenase family)
VYAGTRQPLAHADGRVTPLTLDVTNAEQIRAAVDAVESLDILTNNAGVAMYDDLSDRAALEQHLAVNLFGTTAPSSSSAQPASSALASCSTALAGRTPRRCALDNTMSLAPTRTAVALAESSQATAPAAPSKPRCL